MSEIGERRLRRRRVRINSDGSLNEEDVKHNNEGYRQNMLRDNVWMVEEIQKGHATEDEFLAWELIREGDL